MSVPRLTRSQFLAAVWLLVCAGLSFGLRGQPLLNVAPLGLAAGVLWIGFVLGPMAAWALGLLCGMGLTLLALGDGIELWVLNSSLIAILIATLFPIPWTEEQTRARQGFDEQRAPLEGDLESLRRRSASLDREVDESEQRSRELDALYHAGREISKLLTLQDTLDFSREILRDTLAPSEQVSPPFALVLLDEEMASWKVGAAEGLDAVAIATLESPLGAGGLLEWVLGQAGPVTVPSCAAEPRLKGVPLPALVRGFSALPLTIQDQALGAVLVFDTGEQRLGTTEMNNLRILVSQIAIGVEKATLYDKIARLSITDGLTGLHVHRHFQSRLDDELKRAERYKEELCLLMLDIDHFKRYNDSFGHLAGDQVLKEMARMLRQSMRASDIPARYGGEEFAVILPKTSRVQALGLAETLRKSVAAAPLVFEGQPAGVTISVGLAFFPGDALTKKGLIDKADQALYEAKRGGRNRVVAAWA